jgi:hypothetical protein
MIYVSRTLLSQRTLLIFIDALNPAEPGEKKYVKIGGILVNSSYSGKEYLLVVGM